MDEAPNNVGLNALVRAGHSGGCGHDTPTSEARLTVVPHVLVVDDEPALLHVACAVLDDPSWRLSHADTCAAARAILAVDAVDVLVVDKNLPDGSGLELLHALKRADPLAEGIIVTGYPSVETAVAALGHEAFDYLVKPLRDVYDLKRRVVQALARLAMRRENAALLDDLRGTNARLVQALDEARTLQDELVQAEKLAALGTLAAGVAHEVASPLFGILGLAEAIAEEENLDAAQGHARDIVQACGHIRDVLGDLVQHARDARHDPVTMSDLAVSAREAVRLVERAHPTVSFSVEGSARVRARVSELRQVCLNLVRNAAEACADTGCAGGHVAVEVAVCDGSAVLAVRDDGPGIPEDVRHRVFEPFFTTKPPGKGTGLGLHVAWRIAGRLGGSVRVHEASGGGAVFEMTLPSTPADPPPPDVESDA